MSKFVVYNSGPLLGSVESSGSKNAVLPLLAATLLTEETCEIKDVPEILDVEHMCLIIESFGANVKWDKAKKLISVHASEITTSVAPFDLVQKMRASVLAMGPLLGRTGHAMASLPGGCAIGDRPIDMHLKGFNALGAETETKVDSDGRGFAEAKANKLTGAEIYLDSPSVGATENIIMAAVLAVGTTVIENAAQEPEIIDLANYLNKMGSKIKGAGTDVIKIEGVDKLHGATHAVIPDRIVAGTFMLAAAITRGKVCITNMLPNHVKPISAKLRECGVIIEEGDEEIYVRADEAPLRSTDIKTLPYPGFPTDVQPQFMTFLTTVDGASNILETVFENRFMHVAQLNLMGADILEDGRKAMIPGRRILKGTSVTATDLRAGAALILAGFAASNETIIHDAEYIERGYDDIKARFAGLGGRIEMIK